MVRLHNDIVVLISILVVPTSKKKDGENPLYILLVFLLKDFYSFRALYIQRICFT